MNRYKVSSKQEGFFLFIATLIENTHIDKSNILRSLNPNMAVYNKGTGM